MLKEIKFSLLVLLSSLLLCGPAFGGAFRATKRTDTDCYKVGPEFQVVGSKIYYVWKESDGSNDQIWTAEMNTDGTSWSATQRTTSAYDKWSPQLQLVGGKIYYVWSERDGSNDQIWTAEMNTDGTGWSATKRRTSAYYNGGPQLQVVGGKIYYLWSEGDGSNDQIWTAEMNTNGTGWSAVKRTTSAYNKWWRQFQVVDAEIYYVWSEVDGSNIFQIWTAEVNTDGTGWSAAKRTDSAYNKLTPQLQVVAGKIYYVWNEQSEYDYTTQIWTAEMNTNGTGWSATQRTTSANYQTAQHQVVGSKIYYVWGGEDYPDSQIWTARMNIDGTGWSAIKRTDSLDGDYIPQLQVVGSKLYYGWSEGDGVSNMQIWTAVEMPFAAGMIFPLLAD